MCPEHFQAWGRCPSSKPASSGGDGSPQDGCPITEEITTSMLKVQKNLHSSMEKTRRCCEHLQHPWPCKSRDLLTQPKQKIQEEAGGQGGTAHSPGTKPLLPAGRLWQVLPQSLAWEKNIMRPLCLLVRRELEEDKGILFVQGGGGGEAHLAVPGGR